MCEHLARPVLVRQRIPLRQTGAVHRHLQVQAVLVHHFPLVEQDFTAVARVLDVLLYLHKVVLRPVLIQIYVFVRPRQRRVLRFLDRVCSARFLHHIQPLAQVGAHPRAPDRPTLHILKVRILISVVHQRQLHRHSLPTRLQQRDRNHQIPRVVVHIACPRAPRALLVIAPVPLQSVVVQVSYLQTRVQRRVYVSYRAERGTTDHILMIRLYHQAILRRRPVVPALHRTAYVPCQPFLSRCRNCIVQNRAVVFARHARPGGIALRPCARHLMHIELHRRGSGAEAVCRLIQIQLRRYDHVPAVQLRHCRKIHQRPRNIIRTALIADHHRSRTAIRAVSRFA